VTRREILLAGAASASTLWARSHWDRSRISAITDEIGNTSDAAVDSAHELGLQYVEIRNQPGTNKEYIALREADIQADAAHFVNEGIKVSCIDTSLLKFAWPETQPALATPEDPDQRDKRVAAETARWDRRMDDLRRALHCAQTMGADKVRIFAGSRLAEPSALLQRTAETIGEMALEAERQKITLLLENDPATNVATSAELASLCKLLPSKWVGVSWDPHAAYRLDKPFPAGYALLPKKRILNVHAPARSLTPGGAESEDWKAILLALDHDAYSGKIAVETGVFDIAMARDAFDQLVHIVREVS
jgi:sugar phosphate isomerase/epimerase